MNYYKGSMEYILCEFFELEWEFANPKISYKKKVLLFFLYLNEKFDEFCNTFNFDLEYLIRYKRCLDLYIKEFSNCILEEECMEDYDIERLDALSQHKKYVINTILETNKNLKNEYKNEI